MIVPYDGGVQRQNQRQSARAQMAGNHTADIVCRIGDSWVHGELLGNWVGDRGRLPEKAVCVEVGFQTASLSRKGRLKTNRVIIFRRPLNHKTYFPRFCCTSQSRAGSSRR